MANRPAFPGRLTRLRGRSAECSALDGIVADIRAGKGRALVVRGEAGVGKTALLEYLVDAASDLHVVRATGVESEMELAYAGLHQLCAPLLDRLERLPEPQHEALQIVFGLSSGSPPDQFLVGLAVLSLLSEAADERPLLCVVDDAQWLDHASALTLAFVARRLLAEPVALVFAARETDEALEGLAALEVGGLRERDAQALLGSVIQFVLDQRVRDRIVAETRGNPLALLELPRGLTATQLAGGFGLLGAQALTGRIEESFQRRLEALADQTRMLLVIAAADAVGDPLLLWRAADRLGIGALAQSAEAEGLLEIGEQVTFRHPLVRSAVYRTASPEHRRAAHLALAEVTDRRLDPDRRAWHLASAASGPDEDVASELERSADRAQGRGGLAAAAAFLRRAVALTDDSARRSERALAAAQASLQAGAFDVALQLLAAAEVGPLSELQLARVELLRAEAAYSEVRGSDAPALLLRAARKLEPLDQRLARDTYLDAWSAALFAGELATSGDLHEVSRAALDSQRGGGAERPADVLLDGFAMALEAGRTASGPVLERAARGFAGNDVSVEEVLRWGWLATAAAVMVWDYETCVAVAARGVQLARDSGALAVLVVALNVLAQAVALSGDFERAESLIAEAYAVRDATGAQVAPYGALVLAGLQGREPDASTLIDATITEATAGGQGTAVQYARWARSVVLNGLGRYPEAMAAAADAADDTPELFVSAWALSELVEAATRSNEAQVARGGVERLAAITAIAGTDWARGIEARSRALVSDGPTAQRHYLEAVERLGRTRLRPELGRAHLLYGEWLRRENRRVESRAELRLAHELFTAIGMEAFTERARIELLATGEKVRRRDVETRDELTAQERQIAQLARDGLSNPEIGARMFLSPRTVEWHLRKVFTKLDIGSRRELAKALPVAGPGRLGGASGSM
ncbi:MAG TPA: AAA family ATPase [Solirubrobacteraceae bacterium]|nr:AAA family ATPase [Solirubrobacteraceae bacterium]